MICIISIDSFLHFTTDQIFLLIISFIFLPLVIFLVKKESDRYDKEIKVLSTTIVFSSIAMLLTFSFLFMKTAYANSSLVEDFNDIHNNNSLEAVLVEKTDNEGFFIAEIYNESFFYKENKEKLYFVLKNIDNNKYYILKTSNLNEQKILKVNKKILMNNKGEIQEIGK